MSKNAIPDEQLDFSTSKPKECVNLKIVFTILGKQDGFIDGYPVIFDRYQSKQKKIADTREIAYAKIENGLYYIKGTSSEILDPIGLYSSDLYRKIGDESVWKWKKVSYKVFDYYITYLKTRNKSYYHNASRERF